MLPQTDSLHFQLIVDAIAPGSGVWGFPLGLLAASLWLTFIAAAFQHWNPERPRRHLLFSVQALFESAAVCGVPILRSTMRRTMCAMLALLLVASSCGAPNRSGQLRQGTTSYKFDITTPNAPPVAGDDVTYVIVVRDRNTGQPIETGEGRLFARAGAGVTGSFVKAPQVGQYVGTLRFPRAGGWVVGFRFRDQPAKALELTQWSQDVRSTTPSENTSRATEHWLPSRASGKK